MYKTSFGKNQQITFRNESEFYQAIGYLCRNNRATSIQWENNEEQGAWGSEGRIHFYIDNPNITGCFSLTAGNGAIYSRTNCNEFIENLVTNYSFNYGYEQNIQNVRNQIPAGYQNDFDIGLQIID